MSYGISGQVFGLISFFSGIIMDSFKRFWMVSLHKNILLMLYFIQAPFLASPFLLYINDLPDVICDIAIYVDDTTFYSKCDQPSGLSQQLELVSELESDL